MSADGHTVCPGCHPDLRDFVRQKTSYFGNPGVIDHAAEELGYDRSVRETYEFYLLAQDGEVFLNIDYSAVCWTCDWSFHYNKKVPVAT